MSDPVTRDFADETVRQFKRFQKWNEKMDHRLRKAEVKIALMWFLWTAVGTVVGWIAAKL